MLKPPPDALARLAALKDAPKFEAASDGWYTGVRDLAERQKAEGVVNDVIAGVAEVVGRTPDTAIILALFRAGLDRIELSDTEDRERAASYFEEIMDCIGLESSEGLLNEWMYGFDPT